MWGLLDLANIPEDAKTKFVDSLYNEGSRRGVYVDYPIKRSFDTRKGPAAVENAVKQIASEVAQANGGAKPDLIMVFIERKGSSEYGLVKLVGDSNLKIPTQCVIRKNVLKCDGQTLHNILLKVNSKLSGTNQVLPTNSRLAVTSRPVMFVGADVTHPSPDAIGRKPSIAAMVGSCDPKISKYNCEISLQLGGQVIERVFLKHSLS